MRSNLITILRSLPEQGPGKTMTLTLRYLEM